MLIFAEHITPRLRYVLNFIFRDTFAMDFRITGDPGTFRDDGGPKLNYSDLPFENAVRIPVSGFLSREGIDDADPGLDTSGSRPVLFHRRHLKGTAESGPPTVDAARAYTEFDLFAAVFYMISRYEEYLPFEGDHHGRFEAAESLAGREGFLELPVVDVWIGELRKKLLGQFPALKLKPGGFRFLPTCDVDLPFAYLHRGRARSLASRARSSLQGEGDSRLRQKVLRGEMKDPFDTFSEIEAIHSLHRIRPLIFFLTARYGRFDKSINPRSSVFGDLVRHTVKYADVGIHPSYRSSENPPELDREVRRLSAIAGVKIDRGRQHFLKFSLPGSYRNYLEAGIREEYSMGFASSTGFRAGTARPFRFYDLEKEEETSLRVIPFQVMDRTLKDYMGLTPAGALEKIMALAQEVRTHGGTLVSIWHNDAFSNHGEWKGWKDVYLQTIDALTG